MDKKLKFLTTGQLKYYLRKKALSHKITKEELAWLILNFNQKRGYYLLRGGGRRGRKSQQIDGVARLKNCRSLRR
jgi:hypothetical protein